MTQPPAADTPRTPSSPVDEAGSRGGFRIGRTLALFVLLSLFWLLLSGRFGPRYFVFMTVAVGIVLALNPERPFGPRAKTPAPGMGGRLRAAALLVGYVAWLVWEIMRANIDVAYRILHPSLPIRPRLMRFRTGMRHEVGQVLVANSITLTPGTITVDLEEGEYLVHALHPATAGLIASAELQNRVGPIFGDEPDPPPEVDWTSSYRDLRA